MPQRVFKLNTPTIAILPEHEQRSIVKIPANAAVTLVVGDVDVDGFVQIRYGNQALIMFAEDLRSRGQRVRGQSA